MQPFSEIPPPCSLKSLSVFQIVLHFLLKAFVPCQMPFPFVHHNSSVRPQPLNAFAFDEVALSLFSVS